MTWKPEDPYACQRPQPLGSYGIPPATHEKDRCLRKFCRKPPVDDGLCYKHSMCEKNDSFNWIMGLDQFTELVRTGEIVPHPMRRRPFEEPEEEE